MNERVVLDTSVVVRWFRQEEVAAREALTYRTAYLGGEISIVLPTLMLYELSNVLRYKKDLTAEQVVQAVQSLVDMDLGWADPSSDLLGRAIHIARRCEVSVYDAVFVALAQAISATFVTADDRLAQRVQREALVVLLQEDKLNAATT